MPLRLRILLGILTLTILATAFYKYGGPIWRPILSQIRGEKTVSATLIALEKKGKGLTEMEKQGAISATLVALKKERRLEVWLHSKSDPSRKIRDYPFTGFSGKTGPKLREGDLQIPEGLYGVEYLNPNSDYHLSIKLNYPNAFDQKMARQENRTHPGTDIFVHGGSATIGCIPIGDDKIEDLFAIVAYLGIHRVETILAPVDFRSVPENPVIASISWEDELYAKIRAALEPFR